MNAHFQRTWINVRKISAAQGILNVTIMTGINATMLATKSDKAIFLARAVALLNRLTYPVSRIPPIEPTAASPPTLNESDVPSPW